MYVCHLLISISFSAVNLYSAIKVQLYCNLLVRVNYISASSITGKYKVIFKDTSMLR